MPGSSSSRKPAFATLLFSTAVFLSLPGLVDAAGPRASRPDDIRPLGGKLQPAQPAYQAEDPEPLQVGRSKPDDIRPLGAPARTAQPAPRDYRSDSQATQIYVEPSYGNLAPSKGSMIQKSPALKPPTQMASPPPLQVKVTQTHIQPPVTIAAPEKVTVSNNLSAAPTESFGILKESDSGLPSDIWRNAKRGNLERLLPMFDGGIVHDPIRSLASTLLLTQADMPSAGESNRNLLEMRLRALFQIGNEFEAVHMIEALPASMRTSYMQLTQAELRLLNNKKSEACAMAGVAIQKYDDPAWQKLMIFCQASDGKKDEANLGLDLLREQNHAPEEHFAQLIGDISNPKAKNLKNLPADISVLDASMLIASGHADALPKNYLNHAPLAIFRSLAYNADAPLETRTVAQEQLVKFGSKADDLASLYNSFKFTPKQLKSASAKDELLQGAEGSALLYQLQQKAESPKQRMTYIYRAMDLYNRAGMKPVSWKLYYQPIKELRDQISSASTDTNNFAWKAFTIALMNNDVETARSWLELLPQKDLTNPQLAFQRQIGTLLLKLNTGERDGDMVQAISIPDNANQSQIKRLLRLYDVLEVFGATVDEDARQQQLNQRLSYAVEMPSPALIAMLDDAYSRGQKGEMILTALLALGDNDMGSASGDVLVKSLKSLNSAASSDSKGASIIARDARRIAVQSVLAID